VLFLWKIWKWRRLAPVVMAIGGAVLRFVQRRVEEGRVQKPAPAERVRPIDSGPQLRT
jgi:hypothetical protein